MTDKQWRGAGYIIFFVVYLVPAFLAGLVLGGFFFGGLWWTVQKIAVSDKPYLFSVASFIIRTAVVMGAFYFLLSVDWPYLLAALAGFLVARTVLTGKLKPV